MDVNTLFRQSSRQYMRQVDLKTSFAIHTHRLAEIALTADAGAAERQEPASADCRLLLLQPLVQTAWSDGNISRRESDAILQIAAAYKLINDEPGYCRLLADLTARRAPAAVERAWQDLSALFNRLPAGERQTVDFCLRVQAQFVAEQSSNDFLAFLRGETICERERDWLRQIGDRLDRALAAANENDLIEQMKNEKSAAIEIPAGSDVSAADAEKLLNVVPLVKVAWAEGRVTRRERQIIFEAAARMGIKPDTTDFRRLDEWLELHPTDDFYETSFKNLRRRWQTVAPERRESEYFALLSDCTRVAEASGGAKDFPAGGVRICDEEIAAVKRIARHLNHHATDGN